jgi:hypothetical protein
MKPAQRFSVVVFLDFVTLTLRRIDVVSCAAVAGNCSVDYSANPHRLLKEMS